jgi:hypothetical protein
LSQLEPADIDGSASVKSGLVFVVLILSATGLGQEGQSAEVCEKSLHGFWREKDARQAIALFKELKTEVQKDDRKAVSNMVFYPLKVSGEYRIHNRTAFLLNHDKIFDAGVRDSIFRQVPECIPGNWQGFRTELGEVWIESSSNGPMKVIAVNSESWPKPHSRSDH